MAKAIACTADAIWHAFPDDQERIRDIFTRLTRLDEDADPGSRRRDTRRRVALDDLVPAGSGGARTRLGGAPRRGVVTMEGGEAAPLSKKPMPSGDIIIRGSVGSRAEAGRSKLASTW